MTRSDAAREAGVGIGQIRKWEEHGVITALRPDGAGFGRPVQFSLSEVIEARDWWASVVTENEARRTIGVLATTVQRWGANGRLTSWTVGTRRVYLRDDVEREAARRARLRSMRAVGREWGLPYWILAPAVEQGIVPHESGAKGAYLIDPHDLKPLLDRSACPGCGELLPPGRKIHGRCAPKLEAARAATSKRKREFFAEPENRANISRKRIAWWESEDAERFRSKLVELPCPECGKTIVRRDHELRRYDQAFCSRSCMMRWRWRTGHGMDALMEGMPGYMRKRYLGKWNGHKGAVYGVHNRFDGSHGRPTSYTDEDRARALEQLARGRSIRQVAISVFGDARYKNRVLRIKAAAPN